MPSYTLRIQLVGSPVQEVYDNLHGRMERGGFLRQVQGVDASGELKDSVLPHGTYYGFAEADAGSVRDWASAHAQEVWGKNITFVTQSETWAWSRT